MRIKYCENSRVGIREIAEVVYILINVLVNTRFVPKIIENVAESPTFVKCIILVTRFMNITSKMSTNLANGALKMRQN